MVKTRCQVRGLARTQAQDLNITNERPSIPPIQDPQLLSCKPSYLKTDISLDAVTNTSGIARGQHLELIDMLAFDRSCVLYRNLLCS